MANKKLAHIGPLILFFIILNALLLTGKSFLDRLPLNREVLIIGNLTVFLVTLGSYLVLHKALHSSNPQSFVRAMYISFIIKFFVIALAAFIYIMAAGKAVDKYGLMACMLLYLVYTFIEVSVLTKLLKKKANA